MALAEYKLVAIKPYETSYHLYLATFIMTCNDNISEEKCLLGIRRDVIVLNVGSVNKETTRSSL